MLPGFSMAPEGLDSRSEEALDQCAVSICRPEPQQKAPSAPPPPPPPPPPPLPEPAPPEPEEEILGSDDEEQEDPADYCKGECSSPLLLRVSTAMPVFNYGTYLYRNQEQLFISGPGA